LFRSFPAAANSGYNRPARVDLSDVKGPTMPARNVRWLIVLFACAAFPGLVQAQKLGDVPPGGFRSPEGDATFGPESGAVPLNNLVFELLNRESPGKAVHRFRNPREGWVYLRVTSAGDRAPDAVLLDDRSVALKSIDGHRETMRYLARGPHTISIPEGSAPAARLEVRAIGELFYASYGNDPHITEMGSYTWEYLRRHCLDHYNSIIGASTLKSDGTSTQEAEIREWTSEGKRWFTSETVPYDVTTAEAVYARWANSPGMRHPLMSGIWADEFGVGEKYGKKTSEMYPLWIKALRKMRANPKLAGRAFYAYSPSRLLPSDTFDEMTPFIQTLMEGDYRIGPEWYVPEGRSRPGRPILTTDDLLAEFSPGWEQASRASFERASQGASMNRVVCVSTFSEPGWESSDLFPDYNFNVFLDSQLQFIATDPAFFGIRGVQGYLSGYCGEEQTRLFARLVRHYAIEGNTRRFLSDPYVLPHIQNGDFTDGETGWSLQPAVATDKERSIAPKTAAGFGTLQARYHAPEGTGDTALWTRRSNEKPNVISQTIRQLTPGRLYSLRLITGDYQELIAGKSERRAHAVSKSIDRADLVDSKSFQVPVSSGFWYQHGGFHANNPYWFNYHQIVFRARSDSAELRLTDWVASDAPGGPEGEELLWNFVQIQPYFE